MTAVWMEVSQDRYELPLAIADTAQDLARKCGVKPSTVRSSASRVNTGNRDGRFCRFLRVLIESEG